MLSLAREQSDAQQLEKPCEIINNAPNKNSTSSITKKLKFKHIANTVIQTTKEENNLY